MRFTFARRAEVPLKYFLLAGVGAGVIFRFATLGRQSLWVDEIITLKNSYVDAPGIFSSFFRTLQGPAISLMMHFWAGLSGGDAFMRLPFAVAGALTVLAIYWLAKILFDSWTALHTVFVASLSPILIWYSQEIRGYAFAVLFSVLATYFFVSWLARPTSRNAFLYGVCLFAGLVSNLTTSFVAIAHFAYLVGASGRRRLIGRWIVVTFVVLLLFSPWVREIVERSRPEPAAAGRSAAEIGGGGLSVLAIPYAYFTYGVGYTLGPTVRELQTEQAKAIGDNAGWILLALATFGTALAVGIVRMARTNRNLLILILVWLCVPVAAAAALAALNVKAFNVRYGLVAVPAFVLLTGQGLAAITRTRFWPFVLVFTAVVGVALYNYVATPGYGKEDSREVARIIRTEYQPGDVVVAVYTVEALEHYLEGLTGVDVFEASDIASPEAMTARCRLMADDANRVWLSLCREWMVDRRGTIKAWFDDNMDLVASRTVPGFRLYLYERRDQ